MTKVLVATEKPFAPEAVKGIKRIIEEAGFELALLEKYTDHKDLIKAVADVDALIIRSDNVNRQVIEAGKNLKIVVRAGAGYDNIDLVAATENKVVAMNTPGTKLQCCCRTGIGHDGLFCTKPVSMVHQALSYGQNAWYSCLWKCWEMIARIAKGFGMKVCAYDPFVSKRRY
jgi:D-3-phosphoglycerate dehydrogenase / 2-oxoglutarate reductase